MKQSAKAITLTGLAGATAFAGASQSYGVVISTNGTIVNITAPTTIAGVAPNANPSIKEFYDVDTGTTSATKTAASDLEFGYLNSTTYNESFTGVYGLNGGKAAAYAASNGTTYAYSVLKGSKIGTGSGYAFNQTAGRFTIMSLTYNGTAYGIQQPNGVDYLGFDFVASDGLLHDGWIELESVSNDGGATIGGGLKFIAAAYNSVADAAGGTILAGQTTNAVPEPGTLAALAAGAAGVAGLGLKRRKAARTAQA